MYFFTAAEHLWFTKQSIIDWWETHGAGAVLWTYRHSAAQILRSLIYPVFRFCWEHQESTGWACESEAAAKIQLCVRWAWLAKEKSSIRSSFYKIYIYSSEHSCIRVQTCTQPWAALCGYLKLQVSESARSFMPFSSQTIAPSLCVSSLRFGGMKLVEETKMVLHSYAPMIIRFPGPTRKKTPGSPTSCARAL
jgi:hypothetical protein